ncbi:MAG TPA: hypothetical protein VFZ58_00010 [Candidatus Saccharimonadales bacterium]
MAEAKETIHPRERFKSTPVLEEDDASWLLGLHSQLQLNEHWFNRINKT